MNSIVISGYIANLEKKLMTDGTICVSFSICDHESDNVKTWYKCNFFTRSDKQYDYIAKKQAEKHQFAVCGKLQVKIDDKRTYLNVKVLQFN